MQQPKNKTGEHHMITTQIPDTEVTVRKQPSQLTAVMPVMTPQEARAAMKAFEDMKTALLAEEDIQEIRGKRFIKRSGVQKLALAFNLSVRTVSKERVEQAGKFVWLIEVEAVAPNGRTAIGMGACDSTENIANKEHNVFATAQTRANSRAILNLIGGGTLSAEELEPETGIEIIPPPKQQQTTTTSSLKTQPTQQVSNWFPDPYRSGIELCTTKTDPLYEQAMYALSDTEHNLIDVKMNGYVYSKAAYNGTPCIQRKKELRQ